MAPLLRIRTIKAECAPTPAAEIWARCKKRNSRTNAHNSISRRKNLARTFPRGHLMRCDSSSAHLKALSFRSFVHAKEPLRSATKKIVWLYCSPHARCETKALTLAPSINNARGALWYEHVCGFAIGISWDLAERAPTDPLCWDNKRLQ